MQFFFILFFFLAFIPYSYTTEVPTVEGTQFNLSIYNTNFKDEWLSDCNHGFDNGAQGAAEMLVTLEGQKSDKYYPPTPGVAPSKQKGAL